MVRFAHLSPDTPAVDVAVAPLPSGDSPPLTDPGPDVATHLAYGDVSAYASLAPGPYAVSLRAAGSPRSTPPQVTERVDVPAGRAQTIAITGLFADLSLRPVADDLTAPPAGSARLRVLAAASGLPSADVRLVGGPVLATHLRFGDASDPVDVPGGAATVTVTGAAPVHLDLPAGTVDTLLVLDAPDGGVTARLVRDAAGPAVTPVGAVEAGGGGTAAGAVHALVAAGAVAAVDDAPVRRAAVLPSEPVHLSLPSVGIDTALTAIDLDAAGALVPPSDNGRAGWYRSGAAPGEPGPAVLTGHVDTVAGPAVFFRLRDVAVGDPVSVVRADGTTLRFTVTRLARYPKDAFPTAEVYAPTVGPELRLITCGGAFDRAARSYLDDVVVSARLS